MWNFIAPSLYPKVYVNCHTFLCEYSFEIHEFIAHFHFHKAFCEAHKPPENFSTTAIIFQHRKWQGLLPKLCLLAKLFLDHITLLIQIHFYFSSLAMSLSMEHTLWDTSARKKYMQMIITWLAF